MARNKYEGQVVRVALFAGDAGVIRDATFERCDIKGPALLVPRGCSLENNRFDGSQDAVLWEIPAERQVVRGAVLAEHCAFMDCHFTNIGIAGPKELIDKLRRTRKQRDAEPP